MTTQLDFDSLKAALRGELIQRNDEGYDNARKVYNGMIDKRPLAIVRCRDASDVIAAVNFGRENKLLIAVRGGGHNGGGFGVCNDGLVIDLSGIKYAHVNPGEKTVRVGGGSTWGDVDHATHAFGLATPSGIISTTGVGGLTLGGGLGHLTRKYGLAIDNLLSVDMVLADGSFITADEKNNKDLFWAVRGGGGNFGIVTSFVFRLHPVHTLYAGPMLWDISDSEVIMKWYREFIVNAPDDINGFFAFLTVPPGPPFPEDLHNKKMCGIVWCYTGPADQAEKALEPIRTFRKPALDFVGPIPHPALQGMFDAVYPPGYQWYWRADFVKELSDEAITKHIQFGKAMPTMHSTMHLYPINGAPSRVNPTDTPWAHRDVTWAEVIVGVDPDPKNKDIVTKWTKDYYDALHPYSTGGAYVNFLMEEGADRIKETYGKNYDRLVKIKNKYDPDNVFSVNQNIKPAAKEAEMAGA